MSDTPTSPVPLEDLRRRVREAESLIGVARGLARDELKDPERCEHARDRILSILKEIDALVPGLRDPILPVDPLERVAPSMRGQVEAEPAEPSEAEIDEDDEPTHFDDRPVGELIAEWGFDLTKLAAAIENEAFMSMIPEVDREWFKTTARRSIEAKERIDLCDRVRRGFDDLAQTMRQGLSETSRQLCVALTFEQLKAKSQQ
jgi:hypothetical protein